MPVVFEAVPLGAAGRQRQDRIEAVQGLNRRFLIDGEDRGVVGRVDIQPDHVGGFGLEVGVVRQHVALEAMRLQPGTAPGLADEIVVNLQQAPFASSSVTLSPAATGTRDSRHRR